MICLLSVFSMKVQYDESYIKEVIEGCKKIVDTNMIFKDCYLCVYQTGKTFSIAKAYNPTIPGVRTNEAKKEKVYSDVDLRKTIKINQTCANMISQEIE